MSVAAPEREGDVESELSISGMTCASCVSHVGRALRKVPGVRDVAVNLATERATVLHDPATVDAALVAAVDHAGYGATPIDAAGLLPDDDAEERAHDLARKRRLLVLAVVLVVPTMLLAMATPAFPGRDWLECALTVPVWAIVGWEFHRSALAQVRHGNANMDTLVSLGSTAALGLSIAATIAGRPSYYESAGSIVALIFAGKYLETLARGRSTSAMRALLALQPRTARRLADDGSVREVAIETLRRGDRIVVPAGERIPVDGVVLDGASAIDVAMLTGEPVPRDVFAGDRVDAGTINGDGTLTIRATAVGAGTTLAAIVAVVRRAQGSTPPVQRLADRVAGVFVPAILVLALATAIGWIVAGRPWWEACVAAVAVLVVACPCALGLATPTAIMVGVGVGARAGLLFRDAAALERLGAVDVVVFDKTGTLTVGRPAVVGVRVVAPSTDGELLAVAAAVERGSAHPLAAAIVRAADARGVFVPDVAERVAERGHGMRARIEGTPVALGSRTFLSAAGIAATAFGALAPAERPDASVVYVARGGALLGAIDLADDVRAEAPAALAAVRALHAEPRLVSGDVTGAVDAVADRLGIAARVAGASPEKKAEIVRDLRATGRHVAFVGDGINDAPALASADVGIAMGSGTEIALETAQAAILSNDPRAVATAIRLSRATTRTIRENLGWAIVYNAVLVPLAMLGHVEPMFAAAAMGLSSLFVVGNSLRLRRFQP